MDPVLQIHTVEIILVMVLKLVILVLATADPVNQIVGMVLVRIRLEKPARIALTTADPALPQIHIVGTRRVMETKAV